MTIVALLFWGKAAGVQKEWKQRGLYYIYQVKGTEKESQRKGGNSMGGLIRIVGGVMLELLIFVVNRGGEKK